ncbi:MAG: flagellar biosynthesis protein FlgJ [Alphaproteobacteria bacterium]|nr:flagellar biosynthesis protein FlgJ [Alphaproteobacteria bacterium]
MSIDAIGATPPVDIGMVMDQALAPAGNLRGHRAANMAEIDKAAQDFEAMFAAQMYAPMWEGIETDGDFGGGRGEEVFRGFMIQEFGRMTARSGTLGVADHVKATMIAIQEGKH